MTMPTPYLTVRFRSEAPVVNWPAQFVILTAYATTGLRWDPAREMAADAALQQALTRRGVWHVRLTGYASDTGHAEPGWAAALSWEEGCTLGVHFAQDAIYWVEGDALSVTYCDARRALVRVGGFRERLDPSIFHG